MQLTVKPRTKSVEGEETIMPGSSFSAALQVDRPPEAVYDAIIDPRKWWSENVMGDAGQVGAEFEFDSPGHHLWKFRVVEAVRPTTVRWQVTDDSSTDFVADPTEWNGTEVRFEIASHGNGTRLLFTHHGLIPDFECFEACSLGWTGYIQQSLRDLVTSGTGQPGRY